MTLPKGYTRLSVKKSVQKRLDGVKQLMENLEPEKYDKTSVSYNTVISWLLDEAKKHHMKDV